MKAIYEALAGLTGPAVLATVIRVEGSAYRREGAKMLIPADGPPIGMISGGCLEADVADRAGSVLREGRPRVVSYDLRSPDDSLWGLNMGCNGLIEVLLEPVDPTVWQPVLAEWQAGRPSVRTVALPEGGQFHDQILPPPVLWVVGAGADAPPLVRAADAAGWRVCVADRRAAYADPTRLPEADRVLQTEPEELAALVGEGAYAVLMHHHFDHDREFLQALLTRPARYLGVLGPLRRTQQLLGSDALPDRVYAPVGLNLGGETPAEIALAIVAELQAIRYGRTPGHLRGEPIRQGG